MWSKLLLGMDCLLPEHCNIQGEDLVDEEGVGWAIAPWIEVWGGKAPYIVWKYVSIPSLSGPYPAETYNNKFLQTRQGVKVYGGKAAYITQKHVSILCFLVSSNISRIYPSNSLCIMLSPGIETNNIIVLLLRRVASARFVPNMKKAIRKIFCSPKIQCGVAFQNLPLSTHNSS